MSTILPATNGFNFAEKSLIKRLLRGMFKKRSTFPSYVVTYDIMYTLDKTSLELTSKILKTMMCLLSGLRSQTLVSLSSGCMYLNNSRCVFYISKSLGRYSFQKI